MAEFKEPSLVQAGGRALGWGLPEVGPLAWGCWRLTGGDVGLARALLETAVELGMNLVDSADVYGLDWGGRGFGANEELLGRALAHSDLRDRVVLATKGGIVPGVPYDSSAGHLRRACEASLRRLRVDVIDLYLVHRPDPFTHPAEVADALRSLQAEGKIRAYGVSNYRPAQYKSLRRHLGHPPAAQQVELSVLHGDPIWDGTLDLCLRDGSVPLAWSPLAGGRLARAPGASGRAAQGPAGVLAELAEREDLTPAALAVAFVLSHPARPVAILGTQNPDRLRQAARAVHARLDRADVYRLLAAAGLDLP